MLPTCRRDTGTAGPDITARHVWVRVHRPCKVAVLRYTVGKYREPRPVGIGVDDGVAARRRGRRWASVSALGWASGSAWGRASGLASGSASGLALVSRRAPVRLGVRVCDVRTLAGRMTASGPAERARRRPRQPLAIRWSHGVHSVSCWLVLGRNVRIVRGAPEPAPRRAAIAGESQRAVAAAT